MLENVSTFFENLCFLTAELPWTVIPLTTSSTTGLRATCLQRSTSKTSFRCVNNNNTFCFALFFPLSLHWTLPIVCGRLYCFILFYYILLEPIKVLNYSYCTLQGVEEALFEEEAPRQHDRPPHMPLEDRIIVFTQLFSQLVGPSKALGLDQEGIYRLLHHPVVETLPASVVAAALQVVRGKKYSTVDYAAAIQEVWGAYIDPNEPANDAAVNVMHKILRPANFEDIKLAHSFPLPDELFQAAAKSGIDITALPDLHADVHQMQAPSIMDALDSVKGWSEVANLMGRQSAQGGLVSMAQVEEASKAAVQTLQKFSADIRAHKRDVLEALSLLHEQAKLAENAISASRTRLISCSNHTRSLVLELMGVLKLSSSDDASSTARKPQQKQQQQQHQQVSLFASNGGVDVKQQHQGSGVAQPLLAWPHNSQIVSTTAAPISYGLPAVGGPPPTAAATAMALQAVASNVNLAPTVSYSTLKIDDFIDKYKVLEGLSEHGKEIMRKLLSK